MKFKFFFFLLACSLFLNNSAASTGLSDEPPAFTFNPEGLAKPASMKCMQWIDVLEAERSKADCIGNFAAFKAFTKEISATIGGKYGISTRKATPEEQAALIYSITRTRHNFCGERNMLSNFYGVGEVNGLESHHKSHLAAILAVDTMVTKAINDEVFKNQWAAVKSVTPAAASFIATVKEHARSNENVSVITALHEPLVAFLKTNHSTIALANDIFNSFASKPILNRHYNVLNADSLHSAYQDFLDYYCAHVDMAESGIRPEILFAQELRERDEPQLALKFLSYAGSKALGISKFSTKEISVIHDCIRWISLKDLLVILEGPNIEQWLRDLIYQIFPNHPGFFAAAKLAASDDFDVRKRGALALYDVMTSAADINVKRAASLVIDVCDAERKSFLSDMQLEEARIILTGAFNDRNYSAGDRLFFADALLWAFNANNDGRLGSDEQRQALLNTLFELAHRSDLTPEQRIMCGQMVVGAGSHNKLKKQYVYLAPEVQRRAALGLILQVIADNSAKRMFRSVVLHARKNSDSEVPYSQGEHLLTLEQRGIVVEKLRVFMRKGREYQKLEAAWDITFEDDSDIEIKKEAAEVCFSLLGSPFLNIDEQMRAARGVLDAYHIDEGKHTRIATDEKRRVTIKNLLKLMILPGFETFHTTTCVSNILGAKDSSGKFLVTPAEITLAIDHGMAALGNPNIDASIKFWLAREIFEAEKTEALPMASEATALLTSSDSAIKFLPEGVAPNIVTGGHYFATSAQLRTLIPIILENLKAGSSDDYFKRSLAQPILERRTENSIDYLATDEQRREALRVFVELMNDDTRGIETRKDDANRVLKARVAAKEGPITGFTSYGVIYGNAPLLATTEQAQAAVNIVMQYVNDRTISGLQRQDRFYSQFFVPEHLLTAEHRAALKEIQSHSIFDLVNTDEAY